MSKIKHFLYHWSITRFLLNTPKHRLFRKHLNPVFIETGSFKGDGIRAALRAGFPRIISIEISKKYWNHCLDRFYYSNNVTVYNLDSLTALPGILSKIDKRCTFWLDAHNDGVNDSPLMRELQIIKEHHINDHTIIIDDMRLFRQFQSAIEMVLYSINPNYKISYKFGVTFNDVLICTI